MKTFCVIFRVPVESMDKWQKEVSADERKEQMDAMMQDWGAWSAKNKAAIIDNGKPLGKTKTVTKDGVKDTRNDLNYMMIVQAESHDAAAALFADNPHLEIPTSSIDVIEIPHMGM